MKNNIIRKITVGKDYKNDSMHYAVDQEVYGGHKICDIVEEEDKYNAFELTGERLILCFGKTKDIRELNQADGFKYQNFLVEKFNQRRDGTARRLCTFEVDAGDSDVVAYEPIFAGDDVVGFCTSGGYSHYADRSIAMGFLPTEMVRPDVEVEIEILGKRHPAKRIEIPLFDADGTRMRG